MTFINDNQIKMRRCKYQITLCIPCLCNGIEHCGICRKYNSGISVFFIDTEITQRHPRQIVLKIFFCLLYQSCAICQKKYICHIAASTQHICQTGGCSCFSSSCCHDQQMFSFSHHDFLTNGTNSFLLIIPICDFIINLDFRQIFTHGTAIHQFLQITFAEYTDNWMFCSAHIIPEICIKTICRKHHGFSAIFPFQTLCIQHCLFSSDLRVFAGTLCLYDSQGHAILAKKNIVHISFLSGFVFHVRHFVFFCNVCLLPFQFPPHQFQIQVDILFPRSIFRKVIGRKVACFLVRFFLLGKTPL